MLIILLAASPVAAQNPAALKAAKEQQRTIYERATAEYRLGYFEKAAALYEEAYRLSPDPALLYNIGQAYRKGGQREKALVGYRSYLRTATPDLPNIDLAKQRIAELQSMVPANVSPDGDAAMAPQVPFEVLAHVPSSPSPAGINLASTDQSPDRPATRRWWLWSAAGALVVGGIVTTLLVANRAHDPMSGSVGTAVVP